MSATARGWIVDCLVGGIAGAVLGAILAVNFVITVGIEGGYEASIPEVFEENLLAGLVTVALLVGGPLVGILVARQTRGRRANT